MLHEANESWKDINNFMRDNLQKFKPFVYYQKSLDMVKIRIKDCSMTEIWINNYISICKSNHTKKPKIVGFNIYFVSSLIAKHNITDQNNINILQLIQIANNVDPKIEFAGDINNVLRDRNFISLQAVGIE